jgi:hypothetical protein
MWSTPRGPPGLPVDDRAVLAELTEPGGDRGRPHLNRPRARPAVAVGGVGVAAEPVGEGPGGGGPAVVLVLHFAGRGMLGRGRQLLVVHLDAEHNHPRQVGLATLEVPLAFGAGYADDLDAMTGITQGELGERGAPLCPRRQWLPIDENQGIGDASWPICLILFDLDVNGHSNARTAEFNRPDLASGTQA